MQQDQTSLALDVLLIVVQDKILLDDVDLLVNLVGHVIRGAISVRVDPQLLVHAGRTCGRPNA